MATFKVKLNEQEIELEAVRQGDMLRIWRDGTAVDWQIVTQDGAAYLLERTLPDGRRQRLRLAAHVAGDKRQVWVNGRTFTYERVRERGSGGPGGDGSLAASIPAVVSQILVNVGDTVAEGDKLILLESMKMVIPIVAPYAGVVTAVHCTPGESVQADVPLLSVEPVSSEQ
ncbi:MAG: acetyl-CoA carboxylase biotin carboxyl carrier protein subunit [Ardenticatenaceae bacterium]|nr:acetyl-CoA carboxylase biotin carboxyl carrier protein subunit [Ardenticatenaceae bacterium]